MTDIRFITDLFEYKLQLIGFTNSCYLAPILVYELGKRTQNPIYNYEKSEVWNIWIIGIFIRFSNFGNGSLIKCLISLRFV